MNCPNCGAALEPVPNRTCLRCPYCKSVQFPEPINEGLILLDRERGLDCPCCSQRPLMAAALFGDTVGYCLMCRGILIDSEHFAVTVAHCPETQSTPIVESEPIDPVEFHRVTHCPQCKQRMDTHAYGAGGNAVIDSCEHCQLIWLDAGELTVVERFQLARRLGDHR